jgi:hypothetical protein
MGLMAGLQKGRRADSPGEMVVFRHEREITVFPAKIRLLRLTIVLGFVVGIGPIGSGIILSYLRVPGTITVRLFRQVIEIAPVGICCIFLGVVLILGVVHLALKSLRRL